MNAVIMAAGTASRFVPLSLEKPKGLLDVKGEVLIERQIRQLKEAGIHDIVVVVGYKAEQFYYLKEKHGVRIVLNDEYDVCNNTSSIIRVADFLEDTFICSSDNYFTENVFAQKPDQSLYSALYAEGKTNEYCLETDDEDNIVGVTVGGSDSWYMVGYAYFTKEFSKRFREILIAEYHKEETRNGYWEDLYCRYMDELPKMRIRRYDAHEIEEFDSLEELREFDESYVENTGSAIIENICSELGCRQGEIRELKPCRKGSKVPYFEFLCTKYGKRYRYDVSRKDIVQNIYDREHLLGHLAVIFPGSEVGDARISQIGGMSNKNFKVTLGDRDYVLRVPGNGSEGMVNRANEYYNAMAACRMGVTPQVRYFNPESGVKLTDLIQDAETLTAETIQDGGNMKKVAHVLKAVHTSAEHLVNEFNVFREIEKYDKLIERYGARMYPGWEDVHAAVMKLEPYLEELGTELCPCHNDTLYENFIKDKDGNIYLIDWEYSGMNDPMADFAALFVEASFSDENKYTVLSEYFDGCIPENAFSKVLCYTILWDYLWSQWTVIKEANGDDFGTYGIDRFIRAVDNLKILNDGEF